MAHPLALLALARVRSERSDLTGARELLDEARKIVESYPDAGIFSLLLERQDRELGRRRHKGSAQNGELTERELAVLRLFEGELSHRQIGEPLCLAQHRKDPRQVHLPQTWRLLARSGTRTRPLPQPALEHASGLRALAVSQ
jgi:hypothetical protein